MSADLESWIERQYGVAARGMLRDVSPIGTVKTRPFFDQRIAPKKGAFVASAVLASYDPDPDYFFHWYRDSAIVLDAVRLLYEDGSLGSEAVGHFQDFVRFSRSLRTLDGRRLAADPAWRANVFPEFTKFLRTDADLARVHGDEVLGETRVNPDGTLDISSWPRPQNDGPALRALSVLRWMGTDAAIDPAVREEAAALVEGDLAYVAARHGEPSFDIWEEEPGLHYYTLRVQAAALASGADWLDDRGRGDLASRYRRTGKEILERLDGFWLPEEGFYGSRILATGMRSTKERDIAVILAEIHARAEGENHSVRDPRAHATLAVLERVFDAEYAINRERPPGRGPAMGRYPGDVYYSGGAYYFSTLGAAEFCFRAAAAGYADPAGLCGRGDAFLETVRAVAPADGKLAEQFDRTTGEPASCKELAWSCAAFVSCVAARRMATAHVR